jgi:hypothetical protein
LACRQFASGTSCGASVHEFSNPPQRAEFLVALETLSPVGARRTKASKLRHQSLFLDLLMRRQLRKIAAANVDVVQVCGPDVVERRAETIKGVSVALSRDSMQARALRGGKLPASGQLEVRLEQHERNISTKPRLVKLRSLNVCSIQS